MGRVNAFIKAGNDNREVSLGGRRSSNKVWAWLNTAHEGGESGMTVKAEVMGDGLNSADRKKKDGDKRRVLFTVELPEPSEHIKVFIEGNGYIMKQLALAGGVLCGMKAADEMMKGNFDKAADILANTKEALAGLEESLHDVPLVYLPGGVTLKHALACVEVVRKLTENVR